MKTFSLETLGCKVNQYESQQIRELLERLGLNQVQTPQKPDLVVINTCCVTHTASAKSRHYIYHAKRLNPGSLIVICGCLPIAQLGELDCSSGYGSALRRDENENVCTITHRDNLATALGEMVNGQNNHSDSINFQHFPDNVIKPETNSKVKRKNKLARPFTLEPLSRFTGQTRSFLKVQDGCDGHCSYCIIPKVRPYVQSKPIKTVLQEARTLVDSGHREIVVTGIFLGSYGQKTVWRKNWTNQRNDNLADLLDNLAQIPNLSRIRLSSLEPADVTERLLDTFCKHCNIMPHLHLSLQSGSDNILRKMCRQYTVEHFMEKVQLIKRRLDRPAITTDIIVGFPTETDADFEQTVKIAQAVGFAKMHVFRFSPRQGTAAAKMQDIVDNRLIKERSQELQLLDSRLQRQYRQQFIGETASVLIEGDALHPHGRSERYFMVYMKRPAEKLNTNELVTVKLIENIENGVIGEIVAETNSNLFRV